MGKHREPKGSITVRSAEGTPKDVRIRPYHCKSIEQAKHIVANTQNTSVYVEE